MDTIEHIVRKEVDRQFRLGTLDLKTLYKSLTTSPRKYIPREHIPREPEVDPMDDVF